MHSQNKTDKMKMLLQKTGSHIKNFFLIYLMIFLVGNTMINLIKDETIFLYNFFNKF